MIAADAVDGSTRGHESTRRLGDTLPVLEQWATELARKNRSTHRSPAKTILRWIES